jgi:hypothetical protein
MNQAPEGIPGFIEEPSNLTLGVILGLGAAAVGAAAWALVTVLTGYQLGIVAVGIGLLVGITVRKFGRGSAPVFSVAGAVLSLAGCVVGNLLAVVGFVARSEGAPFFTMLGQVDLPIAVSLLKETASPMDALFYAIAIYEGFKLATLPKAAAPASPAG